MSEGCEVPTELPGSTGPSTTVVSAIPYQYRELVKCVYSSTCTDVCKIVQFLQVDTRYSMHVREEEVILIFSSRVLGAVHKYVCTSTLFFTEKYSSTCYHVVLIINRYDRTPV